MNWKPVFGDVSWPVFCSKSWTPLLRK